MFCSANSGHPLPPRLSPCFNLAAALGGFDDEETLLHLDLLSHYLLEGPTNKTNGDRGRPLPKRRRRQPEKKDRHSKIFTAQGPRNRRVRLSKDVGRKFFDLQDLLGFDKASKTLDWLLTKSKTAIKDQLIQMKHIDDPRAKSLCSSSECDQQNSELSKKKKKKIASTVASKKKQQNRINIPVKPKEAKAQQKAKEMRAKARARARERTKEKILLRKLTDTEDKISLPYNLNPSAISSTSESNSNNMSGFFCFQPNLIITTESNSNFSQWSQIWDSSITSSSLCALTTNLTSSGVLQISRKEAL